MRNALWVLGSAVLALQVCGPAAAQVPVELGVSFPLNTNARSDVLPG